MNDMTSITIKRRLGKSAYDVIRADLLEQVQSLTVHKWTDFNVHDPGVTILEHIAYAMTDVNYRSQYPVELLLTNQHNEIKLNDHGLFTPSQAYPCRPVSARDLQKYLLDSLPDLAFVAVKYLDDLPGVVTLSLVSRKQDANRQQLIKQTALAYQAKRNLCENLHRIDFVDHCEGALTGTIGIKEDANAVEVLINIFLITEKFLVGDFETLANASHTQLSKESLLDGPRLSRHVIDDYELDRAEQPRSMSALVERVMSIKGVAQVENLFVKTDDGNMYSHVFPSVHTKAIYLKPMHELNMAALTIVKNGKAVPIDRNRFLHEYESRVIHQAMQRKRSTITNDPKMLSVKSPDVSTYSSIQGHFPSNYGINAFGVPSHSDVKRRAQAKQLQGYLLMYDQVMGSHLKIVDNIKVLFSTDTQHLESYPSVDIDDKNVYDMPSLYVNQTSPSAISHQVIEPSDIQRKEKALDYLLAINGREPDQFSFSYGNPHYSEQEQANDRLSTKKNLLENVHRLGENRGGAFNIYNKAWHTDNMSSFEKRIRITLGVPNSKTSLLIKPFSVLLKNLYAADNKNDSKPIINIDYKPIASKNIESVSSRLVDVPSQEVDDTGLIAKYLEHRQTELSPLWTHIVRNGSALAHYKMGHIKNKNSVDLVLGLRRSQAAVQWLYLASFKTPQACTYFANQFRKIILEENNRLNGLHLVEHILLLPHSVLNMTTSEKRSFLSQHRFFNNQMTVFLPSYSTRNKSDSFQDYFETLVLQECPAHLYCHIVWLTYPDMVIFETLLSDWLIWLRKNNRPKEKELAANALREFMIKHLDSNRDQQAGWQYA